LNARLLAVKPEGRKPGIVRLESGQVFRVVGAVRESGLVDIVCEDTIYSVFIGDITQRSEVVEPSANGKTN
jgi:hypothetical protein